MKRNIIIACCLVTLSWMGCNKEIKPEPVTGFDSSIQMNNITFVNTKYVDSIKLTVHFQFLIANDSLGRPDTFSFDKSVPINSLDYNQTIHFNTPAKAEQSSFKIDVKMYNGTADQLYIKDFTYRKDDKKLLQRKVEFPELQASEFSAPRIIYDF